MHRLSIFVLTLACVCTGVLVYWYAHERVRMHGEARVKSEQPVPAYPYITVVPHHDLVKDMRRAFLHEAYDTVGQGIHTVVLISPNHFNSGTKPIHIATNAWPVQNGTLTYAEHVGDALELTPNNEAFTYEHGITNLLDDIHTQFPNAGVVPIIIRRSAPQGDIDTLERRLLATCTTLCTIIASVDFSHYQNAGIAAMHDTLTERLLRDRDSARLQTLAEVDSPETLSLLAGIAAQKHLAWQPFSRTHSGELTEKPYDLDTTSHILGEYIGEASPESFSRKSPRVGFNLTKDNLTKASTRLFSREISGDATIDQEFVSLLIGGDVMLDRGIARAHPLTDYFTDFGRTFWGFHGVLVNHEGVVSDRERMPAPSSRDDDYAGMKFLFPPDAPAALSLAGITIASLANNHADNHIYLGPRAGLLYTQDALRSANITPCGGYADADIESMAFVHGEDMSLAIVCVNAFSHIPDLSQKIRDLKTFGYRVLVYPHWGNEYDTTHNAYQERMAHAWVDAGADMVVGSHPHVVQDVEVYNGAPIMYSLGNVVFDQTFSTDVTQGLLAGLFFTTTTISVALQPIQQSSAPGETYIPKRLPQRAGEVFGERLDSWDTYEDHTTGVYTFTQQ